MKFILNIIFIFFTTSVAAGNLDKINAYHAEINKKLELLTPDNGQFGCYKEYDDRRKIIIKKSILVGGLGILAVPVGAIV